MPRKTKYLIEETVTRTYVIYADDIGDALDAAYEIDETWDYEESDAFFSAITDTETNQKTKLF